MRARAARPPRPPRRAFRGGAACGHAAAPGGARGARTSGPAARSAFRGRRRPPRSQGALKGLALAVRGVGDARQCQVTRGGLDVAAFDARTMEARRLPGLFAAGEALDVDAPCGGYNLHWAWASGIVAGRAAAGALARRAGKEGSVLEVANVRLPLDAGLPGQGAEALVRAAVADALGVAEEAVRGVRLLKRSVDARKRRDVRFVATVAVELPGDVERRAFEAAAARGGAGAVAGTRVKAHEACASLRAPRPRPRVRGVRRAAARRRGRGPRRLVRGPLPGRGGAAPPRAGARGRRGRALGRRGGVRCGRAARCAHEHPVRRRRRGHVLGRQAHHRHEEPPHSPRAGGVRGRGRAAGDPLASEAAHRHGTSWWRWCAPCGGASWRRVARCASMRSSSGCISRTACLRRLTCGKAARRTSRARSAPEAPGMRPAGDAPAGELPASCRGRAR